MVESKVTHNCDLDIIKNIIEDYNKSFPLRPRLTTVIDFVEKYKKTNLFKNYHVNTRKRIASIEQLVKDVTKTKFFTEAQKFNLFSEVKIKLTEHELNNCVATILNPRKTPFGKLILLRLLQETNRHNQAKMLNKVGHNNIIVKREQGGDYSRIDIRIYTILSKNNIIVDIEMKVGSGCETTHDSRKSQTEREWSDLEEFAKSKCIPLENISAYFITPYGTKAKCNKFINITTKHLKKIIQKELKTCETSSLIDKEGIYACRHFLSSRLFR